MPPFIMSDFLQHYTHRFSKEKSQPPFFSIGFRNKNFFFTFLMDVYFYSYIVIGLAFFNAQIAAIVKLNAKLSKGNRA